MKSLLRAVRIGRVLLRYRLDTLLDDTAAGRWLRFMRPFVPRVAADIARQPRGVRLRMALQELGPMFVKFGQILSTRRDVLPHDVADELALLQDRVAPFNGEKARQMVERELGQPIADAFIYFDTTPLASASIAQVHAARLPARSGQPAREVVVKVLRPDVHRQIASDIALLKSLATLVERTHPQADKLRPRDIVAEIEHTLAAELDLQREGANASVLRRFWADSDDLSVPEPIWTHTTTHVLTLERVHGIPSDDIAALDAAGIDRKRLAAKGVAVFYTQVFRDNFFHADAHAGNIWVDPTRHDNPRFIALDFGIMGQLSAQDQYYLAENFMAMFQQDYRRIAELHVQAGWMPAQVRLDELEAAVRAVCEPYFTRPLAEISLGEVLGKLFRTARQYQLTLQPQLILLQKTLLTIEGLGRLLDPGLDIWAVAHPVLKDILRKRYSLRRMLGECRKRLPELITHTPDMPHLVHAWLRQQVAGQHQMQLQSTDLAEMVRIVHTAQRRVVASIVGAGLWVAAVLLHSLDAGGPRFAGIPAASWIAGLGGLGAMLAAWPGRRSFRNRCM